MDTQYYQLVCKKGHQISFCHELHDNTYKFCEKCGEDVISLCQQCNYPILGYEYLDGIIGFAPNTFPIPSYCRACGKPYPWTELVISNALELIALDEDLDNETKYIIRHAIPDLIVDNPTTPVAVAKYKKHISKASALLKNGMYNLLVDVLSEATKKAMFGDSSG